MTILSAADKDTTEDERGRRGDHATVGTGPSLGRLIEAEVGSWPGITTGAHAFGGVEFRFGRVELGHLHGDHLADLPFPRAIRDELVASGRARPHHVLPHTGWVSRRIRGEEDARDVIELFRSSYERLRARRAPQSG